MTEAEIKKWSIDYVVHLLKTHKPKNVLEASKVLRLEHLGSGAYRSVYKIGGVPMVIKFPLDGRTDEKDHTRAEIRTISTINRLKKYENLRYLMPKMYYKHMGHGVIVMHYYKPLLDSKAKFIPAFVKLLDKFVSAVWPEAMKEGESVDIHQQNLGIDEDDNIVFTDLGYFLPLGKGEGWHEVT
jgi:hypothetical protein